MYRSKLTVVNWLLETLFLVGIILLISPIARSANTAKAANVSPLSNIRFGPYPRMVYPVRVGISTHGSSNYVCLWEPGALFVDDKPVFCFACWSCL